MPIDPNVIEAARIALAADDSEVWETLRASLAVEGYTGEEIDEITEAAATTPCWSVLCLDCNQWYTDTNTPKPRCCGFCGGDDPCSLVVSPSDALWRKLAAFDALLEASKGAAPLMTRALADTDLNRTMKQHAIEACEDLCTAIARCERRGE